ncbi:hypothetical protein BS78_03G218900 [Paspalum vaginatum]|nr:hypothetical protein BS78_03G218900 [Paspalum vaginatum]
MLCMVNWDGEVHAKMQKKVPWCLSCSGCPRNP